jgi:hypothetical protein
MFSTVTNQPNDLYINLPYVSGLWGTKTYVQTLVAIVKIQVMKFITKASQTNYSPSCLVAVSNYIIFKLKGIGPQYIKNINEIHTFYKTQQARGEELTKHTQTEADAMKNSCCLCNACNSSIQSRLRLHVTIPGWDSQLSVIAQSQ